MANKTKVRTVRKGGAGGLSDQYLRLIQELLSKYVNEMSAFANNKLKGGVNTEMGHGENVGQYITGTLRPRLEKGLRELTDSEIIKLMNINDKGEEDQEEYRTTRAEEDYNDSIKADKYYILNNVSPIDIQQSKFERFSTGLSSIFSKQPPKYTKDSLLPEILKRANNRLPENNKVTEDYIKNLNLDKFNTYINSMKYGWPITEEDIVDIVKDIVFIKNEEMKKNNEGTVSGGAQKKCLRTLKKVAIGNMLRIIYEGPRGGQYVRMGGKYVPLKQAVKQVK